MRTGRKRLLSGAPSFPRMSTRVSIPSRYRPQWGATERIRYGLAAGRICRQTLPMPIDPNAELSSLASQIDALIARMAEMIDAASAEQSNNESRGLVEAERYLQGARRELTRVQQSPG